MGASTDARLWGASRIQGMTVQQTQKRAGYKIALGVACGIGILGVICLGIGLAFVVPFMAQAGFAITAAAVVCALAGGYQHFLYDD